MITFFEKTDNNWYTNGKIMFLHRLKTYTIGRIVISTYTNGIFLQKLKMSIVPCIKSLRKTMDMM